MKRAMQIVTSLALAHVVVLAAFASVDAWEYLPPLPVSVSAVGCPSGPIALAADPELVVPLVVASQYDRGAESPASTESCKRIVDLVRERAPAYYKLVPDRFVCASVRQHAHELWLERDLNLGNHMWILNGHATSAGVEGFAEELMAAGVQYAAVDGRFQIVAASAD